MTRSSWKSPFVHNDFIEQHRLLRGNPEIILFNRATLLTEEMVGMRIQVYNGNRFFTLLVDADMLGHYVGEFAPTRKKLVAKKKNK